ncbi:MAG: caspase family protein [Elusimicrobia bacterium]|nr:caspase family protein [Elusimicrobiota bacterium]
MRRLELGWASFLRVLPAVLLWPGTAGAAGDATTLLEEARAGTASARASKAGDSPAPASNPGDSIWVFIVSVLEWQDAESFAPFPKQGRRDDLLARFFLEDKKVPEDHVVRLQDAEATLKAVKGRFSRLLKRSRRGDTLFFYYAGHGARREPGVTSFVPFDASGSNIPGTGWAVPDIIKGIETSFKGASAILAADACHSGGLCAAARARGGRVSYACLASAQSSSSSTGEWTFTDSLLRGLTGSSRPDADADGRTTFGELASHIESEMAFAESQLSASAVTGSLDAGLKIADVSYADHGPPRALVRWKDGVDYRATVLGACSGEEGKPGLKVHYAGYKDSADECVGQETVGPFVEPDREHADGSVVYASWDGLWYKASVKGCKLGLYHVRYDGWSAYWDEWVPPSRLRASAPCSPPPCKP